MISHTWTAVFIDNTKQNRDVFHMQVKGTGKADAVSLQNLLDVKLNIKAEATEE